MEQGVATRDVLATEEMPIEGRNHRRLEGLPVECPPHPQPETAAWHEDPRHFPQTLRPIGKEFEAPLTEHGVKGGVGEGYGHDTPLAPRDRRTHGRGHGACDAEHALVDIQPGDLSRGTHGIGRLASDHAGATGDIEHASPGWSAAKVTSSCAFAVPTAATP